MDIQISRESGVPLRLQVGRQIAFLIATGKLKPGDSLPSVRALANRLKVHHNTISQAYHDLADYHLVQRHRGSRILVSTASKKAGNAGSMDLDDVINSAIQLAQQNGYSLQQLQDRVQERLLAHAPDHVLVVSDEPGLRELIRVELAEQLNCPVAACSINDLASNRAHAIGALVVGPHGHMQECAPLLPKDRPPLPITFSSADKQVAQVRSLRDPTAIAVVSISELFLRTARGVFAPALGERHTMREYLLTSEKPSGLGSFGLVFCDSVAASQIKAKNLVRYRLVSTESAAYLAAVFNA
jgi:GntR family transcriptional regulator